MSHVSLATKKRRHSRLTAHLRHIDLLP